MLSSVVLTGKFIRYATHEEDVIFHTNVFNFISLFSSIICKESTVCHCGLTQEAKQHTAFHPQLLPAVEQERASGKNLELIQ